METTALLLVTRLGAIEPARPPYPVRYNVPVPRRRNRVTIAFRLVLALPHIASLYVVYLLIYPITAAAWLILLFSGTYEPGLAALPRLGLRWYARLAAYLYLLRDEYPPWGERPYPIEFELPVQTRQSRAGVFFRGLLVLPHLVALYALQMVRLACAILAWFALLIGGEFPEGLRRLVVGINRWEIRVLAYLLLLRGDYPPFRLNLELASAARPDAGEIDALGTAPLASDSDGRVMNPDGPASAAKPSLCPGAGVGREDSADVEGGASSNAAAGFYARPRLPSNDE